MRALVGIVFLIFIIRLAEAQQPTDFGEVSMKEMTMKSYDQDSSAAAVILFDKGQSNYDLSMNSPLTFKRHVRIKILRKEAFDAWANEKLFVERGNFSKLKGTTYNLENDSIVKSELEENSMFKVRFNKYIDEIKFTLPNVKEGSVIEYSYVIKGDGLLGWQFQHSIPSVWSEYTVEVSGFLNYRQYQSGLLPISEHEQKDNRERWLITNIPAFKPEPYMPNEADYVSRIDFSFSRSSWTSINSRLKEDENFGLTVKEFPFLRKQVDEIVSGIADPQQKIIAVCKYIKENLEWNGTEDIYADDLKKIFKQKKGTAADINLALASMLDKAGIRVDMVLLSTRGNGFVRMDLPTVRQFNYVVCLAYIDTVGIFLDATEKYLPWNVLPERCLNGPGFVSGENYGWIAVQSKIKARTAVNADLILDTQGQLSGKLTYDRNGYAALETRKTFHKNGWEKYQEDFLMEKQWTVLKSEFQNMELTEKPTKEIYEVRIEEHGISTGDYIYINPFVTFKQEENPFRPDLRAYPVDFGTLIEKIYLCSITIPDGYVVDEIPQTKVISLPNNTAKFSYNIIQIGNRLQLASNIQINQIVFMQDEYPNLRELYSRIVAKQAEQIVLKKK